MKKLYLGSVAILIVVVSVFFTPNLRLNALRSEDYFANFTSDSYVLMDVASNTILYGKNAEQKTPVASICKLMTTLLTLEKIDRGELSLDDKFIASEYACGVEGSQAFLDSGSEYSVKDLLKSVIVASANDSAIVLAENIAGNESNFVNMMNNRAKELGMKNTIYSNSTGLPKANQYSTAIDTAILLNKVSNYDLYKQDCSIWMDKLIHPSGRETELVNTNRLIKYYSNCKCGKTGFTDEAGYCLSSMAEKNGMKLLAVALNCNTSADRFKECMELFNYGFSNYENKKVITKGDILNQEVNIKGGRVSTAKLTANDDFYTINKRGDNESLELRYELPEIVNAPIKSNEKIGKIIILRQGVVIGEVGVVVSEDIEKQQFVDILDKIFSNWEL